jgi:diaminohydroxyphosphoribosylaminopyrimidine deaminase/5-amino-6-(5-phosphoribosylamino)uracil reductase
MTRDEAYMQRCLDLAAIGAGTTAPNPMVGCVIVHDDRIIGEGYTGPYGGNHAEVNAINSVQDHELLSKSTLYVSLEPCAHYGKTPPCADLIAHHQIKDVVIGCQDPHSKVNGAGIMKLMQAGAALKVGVLEADCMDVNKRFFTFHQKKRPYIILKWAETSDGFVDHIRTDSNSESLKITSKAATTLVHKWRSEEAAIMVGKNTALLDDPSLTTRHFKGKDPVRILLDSNAEISKNLNMFSDDAETIVYTEEARNLESVLADLYNRNINSVLVEGGPTLHGSFLDAGLWDEVRRFVSPMVAGSGVQAATLNLEPTESRTIDTDRLHIYHNR